MFSQTDMQRRDGKRQALPLEAPSKLTGIEVSRQSGHA